MAAKQDGQAGKVPIASAEVVLPAPQFGESLAFFCERLGFAVATIEPADAPERAVLTGHGLRMVLARDAAVPPGTLRLSVVGATLPRGLPTHAPNGTQLEWVLAEPPVALPPLVPAFHLVHADDAAAWHDGRAGMRYRDLIPQRLGGRYVASHIRIEREGPVADYVHFHRVRLQLLYCWRGAVEVVYEDQGTPFWLRAGDCVLQPPTIRHRVLRTEGVCDVVEIACPAQHATHADPQMCLPTPTVDPQRWFGEQQFVHSQADHAAWRRDGDGVHRRDLGIAAATRGLAEAEVIRLDAGAAPLALRHAGELQLAFVLAGGGVLRTRSGETAIGAGAAITLPAGQDGLIVPTIGAIDVLRIGVAAMAEN
jgi:quercetin dioxygenase-like cupin family protein